MRLVLALSFALWLSLAIAYAVESDDKALGAVLEATDKIVQQLGWKREDVSVSRVYSRRMGQALMYEFDIEFDGNIFPIKLAEDISTWRYVDEQLNGTDKAVVEFGHWNDAALAPFKLAGPVELWIQDAQDLRLAIPNDVDAGALQKVLLADGATVTVLGAREISLTRPFKVPLPLVSSGGASGILALSEQLRQASRSSDRPILSLRVVKPSSLVTSAPERLDFPPERLKVKKLSPGAVELSSRAVEKLAGGEIASSDSSSGSSGKSQWLWPLPSVNTSGATLESLEQALKLVLGPSAHRPGSFNLLRAKAAAATFVKMEFELEKPVDDGGDSLPPGWPEWATRPTIQRLQFEMLSKIDGDKVIPMSVRPLETYPSATTASFDFFNGNTSSSRSMATTFLPPVSPMTLDLSW